MGWYPWYLIGHCGHNIHNIECHRVGQNTFFTFKTNSSSWSSRKLPTPQVSIETKVLRPCDHKLYYKMPSSEANHNKHKSFPMIIGEASYAARGPTVSMEKQNPSKTTKPSFNSLFTFNIHSFHFMFNGTYLYIMSCMHGHANINNTYLVYSHITSLNYIAYARLLWWHKWYFTYLEP